MNATMRITADESVDPMMDMSMEGLLRLAHQYGVAACDLRARVEIGSFAPFRFCVLQAVELCLSALLLHGGSSAKEIRAMEHNLGARARSCARLNLTFRKKSLALLDDLSAKRHYLAVRYSSSLPNNDIHINQLMSLLVETIEKVSKLIAHASGNRA